MDGHQVDSWCDDTYAGAYDDSVDNYEYHVGVLMRSNDSHEDGVAADATEEEGAPMTLMTIVASSVYGCFGGGIAIANE